MVRRCVREVIEVSVQVSYDMGIGTRIIKSGWRGTLMKEVTMKVHTKKELTDGFKMPYFSWDGRCVFISSFLLFGITCINLGKYTCSLIRRSM